MKLNLKKAKRLLFQDNFLFLSCMKNNVKPSTGLLKKPFAAVQSQHVPEVM